ncbi:hypothetical protein WICMUC_005913 [Wickerhamomyces mucosus]|uniref:Small ribosomal subunit protein mS29 n=1 Tax=Wickerhamomyces mucosus TaxID=1378264 RepID=A0A9P8P1Q7_9ASCO|nr:hypothetical protein WICMUC_005913 [Wickerhamomyces mucosus]
MLRLSVVFRSSKLFSTSALQLAASRPVKATAKGFKGNVSGKKNRKTAGSFRFFEDHIHYTKNREEGTQLSNLEFFGNELHSNKVVGFTEKQVQKLVQLGAFKKDQFNELFKVPITLLRNETEIIHKFITSTQSTPSSENRICLLGERGIGKTTLLTQAQALALNNGNTIIIPISYALKLVDGTNDYFYDSKLGTYTQPMYLKKLLAKIEYVNKESLQKLSLSQDYTIDGISKDKASVKFTPKHSLLDLVKANVAGRQRGKVFQILINELLKQNKSSVLLTVDNFSALTSNPITAYRNIENKLIYTEEFQISKFIFQLTSGEISFNQGGVLLATSSDDKPSITLKHGLGLIEADPYLKESEFSRQLASKLVGVKPIEVSKLSKENVSILIEKYIEAQAFNNFELEANSKEHLVNQKYVLSGNGNPLELLKSITLYH